MLYRIEKSFVFTLFGASGDLAKVKIFPALYALAEQKRFPKEYFIFGYSRTAKSDKEFRDEFRKSIKGEVNEKILSELLEHVFYFSGQYDSPSDFKKLSKEVLIKTREKKVTMINYLAVPPSAFSGIITNLASLRKSLGDDLRLVIRSEEHTS